MHPTGILKNEKTGRFHTIPFRLAPMPGNSDADMDAQRYKSIGHHTAGFDTLELAQKEIADHPTELYDAGLIWEWSGEDLPAMVYWFAPRA